MLALTVGASPAPDTLGAPLVAIAKVIFDHVESLKSAGELLGQ